MNKDDIKLKLNNLVNNSIYKSNKINDEELNTIIDFFKNNKNIMEDLKYVLKDRNNENYYAYDCFLIKILTKINKDIKLTILYNSDKNIDILSNKVILLRIWQSLNKKDKLKYLNDKNKCNEIDYYIFNESIKEKTNYKDNYILNEILTNIVVLNKIPSLSLDIKYSPSILKSIDLTNYEICSKFTKKSYTILLLKKCPTLDSLLELINTNDKIINLIERNSIIFKNTENNKIYNYLLDNPNMIGKFDNKYLTMFDNNKINEIYKSKVNNETFSSILERMYIINPTNANKLFTKENLSKCIKHSLNIYPFEKLSNSNKELIFKEEHLFDRFIDTVMIEAISNNYKEQEIMNILRNPEFIKDQSTYSIELLLNKLHFKTVFNMLQIKNILDSINNLNSNITDNDTIFIKGYLDSPSLIYKTDHNMLFNMLNYLNKEDNLYYIINPYISNKLTSSEIIDLCTNKQITINEIIDNEILKEKLSKDDIITFIDRMWESNIDLSIFYNKDLSKLLFNLSDDQVNNINFEEVNYLFETIKMKSLLSKQTSKYTIISYKSVLASYLSLGLDKTLDMVSTGNMNVTLDEVLDLKNKILDERILIFKEENSTLIQNIHNKVDYNLKKINKKDINSFSKALKRNTYLDNITYLMLENNYYNYKYIIETFYNYNKYYENNPYQSKKNLYHFCQNFIKKFISNKYEEYNQEFYNTMYNNFNLKESIIYNKRKKLSKDYIKNQKLKVFLKALTEPNKEDYAFAFKDKYPLEEIKERYIKYLNIENVNYNEILTYILIPISNNTFDKELCLSRLGIKKPREYDKYYNYINNNLIIESINNEINNISNKYTKEEITNILEHICYNIKLIAKLNKDDKKIIRKLIKLINNIKGEIHIKNNKLVYTQKIDIYNIDKITDYNKYLKIISEIINKTTRYINRNMNTFAITEHYQEDYLKNISKEQLIYPLTNKYYEPRKRVFSIHDIENIFNGYRINEFKRANKDLLKFLFEDNNLVMVAEGYYDGLVDNLGLLINKYDEISNSYKELFNEEELTLINAEKTLKLIEYKLSDISKSIDSDIIKSLFDDDYYIDTDIKERLNNLEYIYKESFKKISSTIPYIKIQDNNYEIEIIDNYNQEIFKSSYNTNYRIGSRGNDFLHYVILNKNGIKVIIKKDNHIIARLLGVRNGNTLYLNKLEGEYDNYYEELLHKLSSEIIKRTKESNEPIEFITILINKLLERSNGIRIDSTICPIVENPINISYNDFDEFRKSKYLNTINNNVFYTNYKEKISTILASSNIVDKNNFKYYDPEAKYLRNRNNVIKLSNNIEDYYINKINTIINLCKIENVCEYEGDIRLSTIDTIYIGDDFVLFLTNNKQFIKYVLPYDKRALNEINLIIKSYS